MQTFLPLPGYTASAKVLDRQRLGKQRVECKQILRSLGVVIGLPHVVSSGWRRHPAVLMWHGYEYSLCCYAIAICDEWIARGFVDTLQPQFVDAASNLYDAANTERPPFIGDVAFHRSHQSNLLRKDPVFYGRYGWDAPSDLPYVWPAKKEVTSAVS